MKGVLISILAGMMRQSDDELEFNWNKRTIRR
jgi:hypothetical protein